MELGDYARAIASRWAWAVAAGAAGMLLAGAVALFTPVGYQSTVSLYVDAALVAGPEDPSSAAEVRTTVLPSVAALARSEGVLADVADVLGLPDAPGALAADLDVVTDRDTSVIHVTATRPTPAGATALARTVGSQVSRQARALYPGTDGPLLDVTALRTGGEPTSTARSATSLAGLGAVAGMGLAGVAAGLADLLRPRVRGRADVARVTSAPVLAVLPAAGPGTGRQRRRGGTAERAELVARLRFTLQTLPGDSGGRRLFLVGATGSVASLADELRTADLAVIPADDPRTAVASGPVDGVVVVADGRHTTPAQLASALATVDTDASPLVGVVVDGLLPSGAGWRARVRAGWAGHAQWWLDSRTGGHPRAAGRPAPLATRLVAGVAVAAVGFTHPLPMTLTGGVIAAGALLPLWLPLVRRYRGLPALMTLTGIGLLFGVLLAWSYADDHGFAPHEAGVRVSLVLGAVCGVAVLLWAREVLSVSAIGICFGVAMLATELVQMSGPENIWKFQLSSPLMVIGLALAARWGRPLPTVALLGVLGLTNVVNDARSAFAFCALAACLVLWQARPRRAGATGGGNKLIALALLGLLVSAGYWLLTQLILAGGLGDELQQRTATQIAQTGSLILGGRPEWTVTWALMQIHPFGFGLGIVPDGTDVAVAQAGIATTNIPTAEAYVRNQLLGDGVQLHSILADLWAALGPAGLLLGLVMAGLIVVGFTERFGRREASGLVCLLVPMALWNLPFGPLASNMDTLILALGLLLAGRPGRPGSAPVDEVPAATVADQAPPRPALVTTA